MKIRIKINKIGIESKESNSITRDLFFNDLVALLEETGLNVQDLRSSKVNLMALIDLFFQGLIS